MATLKGRLLLAWIPEDKAIHFLMNDCVFDPPLTESDARALWRTYYDRAAAMPTRPPLAIMSQAMTGEEKMHAASFKNFLNQRKPHDIIDVVKVEIPNLVVMQYVVVTEKADDYRGKVSSDKDWRKAILPTVANPARALPLSIYQEGLNTKATYDLPHGEFRFQHAPGGIFGAGELLRHVTVTEFGGRMGLLAGYHRTFAKFLSTPTAAVPVMLVALAKNTFVSPAPVSAAPGVIAANAGLDAFGERPAYFSDFFTDDFFIDVDLKKKRWQLQVVATNIAIDDQT